jgi:hypothetical protein
MSVRIIIPGNEVNNGDAMGYVNTLGNKKTVDRANPHTIGAFTSHNFHEQAQFVAINNATSDDTIVSGVTGRQIEVLSYNISADSATDITIKSGSTAITGPMSTAATGSIHSDGDPVLRTAVGEALVIDSSAGGLNGSLTYRVV